MQFVYNDRLINLLDTPGHADFSEDTYRTLTAVDSALMVIDAAKGVEARTKKLLEICRMRQTPIMTFINKMDRETRDPLDVIDEIEKVLAIKCAMITWPVGMGKAFRGVYHMLDDMLILYKDAQFKKYEEPLIINGLASEDAKSTLSDQYDELAQEIELIQSAADPYDHELYLKGELTPVHFGSALNIFGVEPLLTTIANDSPLPQPRETKTREVEADEKTFSAFVFKIPSKYGSSAS